MIRTKILDRPNNPLTNHYQDQVQTLIGSFKTKCLPITKCIPCQLKHLPFLTRVCVTINISTDNLNSQCFLSSRWIHSTLSISSSIKLYLQLNRCLQIKAMFHHRDARLLEAKFCIKTHNSSLKSKIKKKRRFLFTYKKWLKTLFQKRNSRN